MYFCSDDYSSVTSADIDNALSGDDDDGDNDKDGGGNQLPPATSTENSRHVAFAEQKLTGGGSSSDLRALESSYAVRQSCFERGSAARQTLPAFTANDLASGLPFRRDMKTSTTPPARDQRQTRPRSKSVGRTATPKRDGETAPSGWVGPPVVASTPKSPADYEASCGERLSNYGQGTLLVGQRRGYPPPRPTVDGSRLLTARGSVDSAMCRASAAAKHGAPGQDGLGELGPHPPSPFGYAPVRRRCITPVNESTPTDATSLFAAYQLRRPQLHPTSDSDSPGSYYPAGSGRRSLPRTSRALPHVPAVYPADSSRGSPQNTAAVSCTPVSPYWPPCGVNSRPQSSAASTTSGSAENIRKNMFLRCFCRFKTFFCVFLVAIIADIQ